MAQETPIKPQIIIETPEVIESPAEEQYKLKDKITSMLFSLGVIVVSIFVLTFIIKKLNRKRIDAANAGSAIKILERRAINPKTFLYVVEVHNKTLLIGESPDGLVTLGELSPGTEELPLQQAPLSFTQILKKKFDNLKS